MSEQAQYRKERREEEEGSINVEGMEGLRNTEKVGGIELD